MGFGWKTLGLLMGMALVAYPGCKDEEGDDDSAVGDDDTGDDDTGPDDDDSAAGDDDTAGGCGAGEVEDYDGECVPQDCGDTLWGYLEVDEQTVFVDANAGAGGDGSEAAPFDVLTDGVNGAGVAGGGLVAVAKGTYVENVTLTGEHGGVRIAGRCPELVLVDGSGGDETPSITLNNVTDVAIGGLTATGSGYCGILMFGGSLDLADVALTGNQFSGLVAMEGAEVLFADSAVTGNAGVGVWVSNPGSYALLSGVVVSGTTVSGDGLYGYGVAVHEGGSATLDLCQLAGNTSAGLAAFMSGTEVELIDSDILDTQLAPDGGFGVGIVAQDGAVVTAEGGSIDNNFSAGLNISGDGTDVSLTDVTVSNTQVDDEGNGGYGAQVSQGGALLADSCVFEANHSTGIQARDEGSVVLLTASEVRSTEPNPDGDLGYGISLYGGASLTAEATLLEGNHVMSLQVDGDGTTAELNDVEIRDTIADDTGSMGYGIQVFDGGSLTTNVVTVAGCTGVGVLISDSLVSLGDLTIEGVLRRADGIVGTGLAVQDFGVAEASTLSVVGTEGPGFYLAPDAMLACDQCSFEGTAFAGGVVMGGVLEMTASTILSVTADTNLGGGVGLYANNEHGDSFLQVSDTQIDPCANAGVWLYGTGSYDFVGNTISGGQDAQYGDAVCAMGGMDEGDLLLSDNTFDGAVRAGVFLDASSATLSGNSYSNNAVDLVQQNCGSMATPVGYEEAPVSELCTSTYPTDDLPFHI